MSLKYIIIREVDCNSCRGSALIPCDLCEGKRKIREEIDLSTALKDLGIEPTEGW